MNNWFECKIRYEKLDEKGKGKKVTEAYLVNALSFSEAEERISKEIAPFMSGEFSISGIKKAGINEIFPNDEGDRWYKCKVNFISIDEIKATEKKITSNILVLGSNIKEAWDHLEKALKDTISDYEVPAITETLIMDIFPYKVEEETNRQINEKDDL
jgi:hypothetical protein